MWGAHAGARVAEERRGARDALVVVEQGGQGVHAMRHVSGWVGARVATALPLPFPFCGILHSRFS